MGISKYDFYANFLCLGERVKGGIYRPCAKTIPYSQLKGALKWQFGVELHAVGVIDGCEVNHLTIAPKDRLNDGVRLPIKVMFLEEVKGKVFVVDGDKVLPNDKEFYINMGGLRSRGFGLCRLKREDMDDKEMVIEKGWLRTRIPKNIISIFEVKVIKPRYGYLFESINVETGKYILSYFEGSEVKGPKFLIEGGEES
ncbi:hypothetical protein KKG61_04180 [bacterium]|nr:hypothetical protein [bacterium]MBU1599286.1 hypothetical protein [bacterium]MBU2461620.1 hypothetical protein [bacterium]